jgi:hypothetical protein
MLYKLRGKTLEWGTPMQFKWLEENGDLKIATRRVFYVEAENIEQASVKAKKLLDHVSEIKQVPGEFSDI